MDTQLTAAAKNLKIALVGFARQDGYEVMQTCPNLQRIFADEDGAEYVMVDPMGLTTFSCDENGLWTESRIDTPVAEHDSRIPKEARAHDGQPVKHPDRKPEGGEKPQDKSEPRPQ